MRVLLVGAAADSSIRDVEYGWRRALERAGHDVRLFNLNTRLKLYSEWMRLRMEGLTCPSCDASVMEPDGLFADQVTIMAAAPSEICEELPAWITPSSVKAGLSAASFSAVVPRRMPSSAVTTPASVGTPTIWSVNAPRSCAAAASSCERAEYSSSRVREKPHFSAIISAEMPWLNEKSS